MMADLENVAGVGSQLVPPSAKGDDQGPDRRGADFGEGVGGLHALLEVPVRQLGHPLRSLGVGFLFPRRHGREARGRRRRLGSGALLPRGFLPGRTAAPRGEENPRQEEGGDEKDRPPEPRGAVSIRREHPHAYQPSSCSSSSG